MKVGSNKGKRAAFFLLGLLAFAVGHTFLIPAQTALAAAPLHHDLAEHANEDEHISCPTDIHQFSFNRDNAASSDLLALPVDLVSVPRVVHLQKSDPVFYYYNEHKTLPLDQKIVLRI